MATTVTLSGMYRRQQGVALITAMLVVTLATILAVGMISRQQFDIRRTGNLQQLEQALLYHMAVEDHATPLLQKYWDEIEFVSRESFEAYTALSPIGYQEDIEGGTISVSLTLEQQGRFNINNLVKQGKADEKRVAQFRRLMNVLEIEAVPVDAIIDWLDADQEVTYPDGAEDGDYLGYEIPYRSANRAMVDRSELMLVKGVEREMYEKLLPHISVLPEGSKMNVNWMDSNQLMALDAEITQGDAESLISVRDGKSFESVQDFIKQDALAGRTIDEDGLTVSNDYFMLHTTVEIDRLQQRYLSLLKKGENNKMSTIKRSRELY
ncbi:MAG: type II secretion system minor pseudopilin GspK [Gammaproteobacteria bacterium]|nr:type II secretion system minor pseudopilin GspK [Gammaproteobacteria bacterium]